jgi:hypothetical protein
VLILLCGSTVAHCVREKTESVSGVAQCIQVGGVLVLVVDLEGAFLWVVGL